VRRRKDSLIPIELAILEIAMGRRDPLHGFAFAKLLAGAAGAHRLTAHGTLYKALGRLAERGLLAAEWEDPEIALGEGRPRRRLYVITGAGVSRVLAEQRSNAETSVPRPA
jgi:PadR family transcriptional regulator PadR